VFSEAQTFMETLIKEGWQERPLVFGNTPFREGANHTLFFRVNILFGIGQAIGLGGQCVRQPASIEFAVFTRPGVGEASAMAEADRIALYFKQISISGVTLKYNFQVPELRKFPTDDKGWIQFLVSCPFYYDVRS